MTTLLPISCKACGHIFHVKKSHATRRKSCSKKCAAVRRKNCVPPNKGKKFPELSRENSPRWKGGKTMERAGYVYILSPDHPNAIHGQYVLEHRLVMERSIGRFLTKKEIVHHKNHVKDDNRLENLELMTQSEHVRLHKPRLGTGI